jgi:hypothetical protein
MIGHLQGSPGVQARRGLSLRRWAWAAWRKLGRLSNDSPSIPKLADTFGRGAPAFQAPPGLFA